VSYFFKSYSKFTFPIADGNSSGFRPAQLAAVQAATSHFFTHTEPAIISMPTGSGKTAVLTALCFTLRVHRALILTPSRLVREQIAQKISSLSEMLSVGALPLFHEPPKVAVIRNRIKSKEDWLALKDADVAVATISSISGLDPTFPDPPEDLFDLVLADEAHHAPAATWRKILSRLADARQVLLTATPFRRDDKEIRGRLVFHYDLKRARADGIFGELEFVPVEPAVGNIDVAIAKATQRRLLQDRKAGKRHLVMVRADSISRARELKKVYEEHTELKLDFVSGAHALVTVEKTLKRLRSFEIDGIVCVNMFGEGFDLPNLKIAAVHSPHKSLAITLQFIGRFARTIGDDIGSACFLAEPYNSARELDELYEPGSPWSEVVANLSSSRIGKETKTREVLETFKVDVAPDLDGFSLRALRPYFHVKIYECDPDLVLPVHLEFPGNRQIRFSGVSDPHRASVYVTTQADRARWSSDDRLIDVRNDLFVIHINRRHNYLFICSSQRSPELYHRLALQIVHGRPRPLSAYEINRVLNDVQGVEFFSVGLRKRHMLGRSESYRMIAGPNADRAIQENDGRVFNRGHVFGKGRENGEDITIGISTASKVWSNRSDQIPSLLEWCDAISEKIASGSLKPTGSKIDIITSGKAIEALPADIVAALWPSKVYTDQPRISLPSLSGRQSCPLVDCDIHILESKAGFVRWKIDADEYSVVGRSEIVEGAMVNHLEAGSAQPTIELRGVEIPFDDFLNEYPPRLFTASFGVVEGNSYYPPPDASISVEDHDFDIVDWPGENVDIRREKPGSGSGRSIFEWLEKRLLSSNADVVLCDDAAGEVADYVSVDFSAGHPEIVLYHCKGSSEPKAGARLSDLYDVCGQAVRSTSWIGAQRLADRLNERVRRSQTEKFRRGELSDISRAFAPENRQRIRFTICIVQPGLSKDRRTDRVNEVLSATKNWLISSGVEGVRFLVSA
jgi:superfamily II DNA or RNA helicase